MQVSENEVNGYINDIQDIFAYARASKVEWTDAKMKRSLQDHKDLIEAICNRDEDRAVELIRKDIEAMRALLIEE